MKTLSGTFTGTGTSAVFSYRGQFNVSMSGVSGSSVNVERSFDSGSTWQVVDTFTEDAELYAVSNEGGTLWRFNCTSFGTTDIDYRFGGE